MDDGPGQPVRLLHQLLVMLSIDSRCNTLVVVSIDSCNCVESPNPLTYVRANSCIMCVC